MADSLIAKRLTTLLCACMLTTACKATPAYSDYFVVAFLPGTPAPSQEGVEALRNAVRQASRSMPRAIAVDGFQPASGSDPPLEKQRAQAILDAFAKAGVNMRLVHIDLRPADEKSYAESKDSFAIQLAYGAAPKP